MNPRRPVGGERFRRLGKCPDAAPAPAVERPVVVPPWRMAAAGCTAARVPDHAHREGLARSRRANWKHGRRSAEAMARRKEAAAIRREIRRLIALVLSA